MSQSFDLFGNPLQADKPADKLPDKMSVPAKAEPPQPDIHSRPYTVYKEGPYFTTIWHTT